MLSLTERHVRSASPWIAIAAIASWSFALWQALPRLMAGPLCTAPADGFTLAGHCPACVPAVVFTLVFVASLLTDARQKAARLEPIAASTPR